MTLVFLRVWYILPYLIFSSHSYSQDINTGLDQVLKIIEKTPTQSYLKNLKLYYQLLAHSQTKQNHWSLSSELSRSTLNEQEGIESERQIKSDSYQLSLAYSDWSGVDISISRQNNNELYQIPSSSDLQNEYYTNSVQLSFELVQAGESGIARSQAFSSFHEYRSELEGIKSSEIEFIKNIQNHFISYYVSLCKVKFLQKSQMNNNSAYKKALAAFKTDNLNKKDFLNIKVTSNSVKLEIIQQQSQQANLREQAIQFGIDYVKHLQSLTSQSFTCQLQVLPQWVNINEKKLVALHPNIKKNHHLIHKSKQDVNYVKSSYKPSIKPFIKFSQGPESFTDYDNQALSVGVQASWILPSDKSSKDLKSTLAQRRYAHSSLENEKYTLLSEVNSLKQQFVNNKNILREIQNNIATYQELLNLLRARISVGKTDSITYSNTYNQFVNSQINALDIYAEIIKTTAYMKILNKVIE